jgi:hypothetical protein
MQKIFFGNFLEDMEGGIETTDKFGLISLWKKEEKVVQLIFPTHPLTD